MTQASLVITDAPHPLLPVNPQGYGVEYYARTKAEGLDLLSYGTWQERYGRWLVDVFGWRGRHVLDVGCACGSMLRGLLAAGADIDGVDCSEFLVQLGREQWPDLAGRLFIGDAVNLHSIADASYNWLHSCVVAEHWRPELVPFILAELLRVTKPGGGFFCAYESGSGSTPGVADPAAEPTHICLRPPAWWEAQLLETGWELCSDTWRRALHAHPQSFFGDYHWDWFVARRPP